MGDTVPECRVQHNFKYTPEHVTTVPSAVAARLAVDLMWTQYRLDMDSMPGPTDVCCVILVRDTMLGCD